MLTGARMLHLEDLPVEVKNQSAPTGESATTMEEAEKRAVIRALGETKNKALAARKLRISRARLYRLMAKYGLADCASAEGRFNQATAE
jgi:transcriptional regulator with PAS, ATPase and Fis domain